MLATLLLHHWLKCVSFCVRQSDAWSLLDARHGYKHMDKTRPSQSTLMYFLQKSVVKRRLSRDPRVFLAASPVYHASRMTESGTKHVPFLIVHGDRDCIVPIQES